MTARALIALALGLAACGGKSFEGPMRFGDKVVEARVLDRGHDVFNRYCATCHGTDGKAQTAQSQNLDPKPRDFTAAHFKHKLAEGDALPTDLELKKVVRHGVPGTGMPGWPNLDEDDLDAIIQYIKTFSPRWQSEAPPSKTSSGNAPGNAPENQQPSGSDGDQKTVRPAP